MAQLLKPGMLNFKEAEMDQSETLNPIVIHPVVTGENGVDFQPILTETPENGLENLWATAKNNGDQKRKTNIIYVSGFQFFIGDCLLDNNETFFKGKNWVLENEFLRTHLIWRVQDILLIGYFGLEIMAILILKNLFLAKYVFKYTTFRSKLRRLWSQ